MKHEKLFDAMEQVSDAHIAQAAKKVRSRIRFRIGLIAAVLAVVIALNFIHIPAPIFAATVSAASESRLEERPRYDDYSRDEWDQVFNAYLALQDQRSATAAAASAQLTPFFKSGSAIYLGSSAENRVWSPVNAYIGLAMAAELSGGESREQILTLLNTADLNTLRAQVSAVWESVYEDDGHEISVLANSLWLDKETEFHQSVMDDLAYHYYASVYQVDLGSHRANSAIQTWLNNNTGGLLKNQAKDIDLSDEMVMALYSTIYFQTKWTQEFNEKNNREDTFHAPAGDITVTYMNASQRQMNYYWGDHFGAVAMSLKNGSRMWLILPDENSSVDEVLSDGQYLDMMAGDWENSKYMKVNLSMPKFDITARMDLQDGLKEMGVTDIFSASAADFSPALDTVPAWFTGANQATRVIVDETGVKAAAYIELPMAGAAAPPEEIIDFVLDRPFLFVITSDSLPLFAGVVNEP